MLKRVGITSLSVSAVALVAVAVFEGYRGSAYQPIPNDKITIGFGATDGVKPGQTTDPVRALIRLQKDADEHAKGVKNCVRVPLYQHEFDAYVSFTFNVGVGAFCKSTLVMKLNAGDYAGACAELDRWVYAQGQKLNGLVIRRANERAMCEGKK